MKEISNEQIIERVNAWQDAGFVHPLTCVYHSEKLFPVEEKYCVVLRCPHKKCHYSQNVPPSIKELDIQILNDEKEKLINQGFKF
jgi:hypothetical protein